MITKELLRSLRPQIDAALAEIAKTNGLESLKTGSATFTSGDFKFALLGVAKDGVTADAREYDRYRQLYAPGLPARGETFPWAHHEFAVTGLKRSRVTVVAPDGKHYLIKLADLEVKFPRKSA